MAPNVYSFVGGLKEALETIPGCRVILSVGSKYERFSKEWRHLIDAEKFRVICSIVPYPLLHRFCVVVFIIVINFVHRRPRFSNSSMERFIICLLFHHKEF